MGFTPQQLARLRSQTTAFRETKSGHFPSYAGTCKGVPNGGKAVPIATPSGALPSGSERPPQGQESSGTKSRLGPVTPNAPWRPRLAVSTTQKGPIEGRSWLEAQEVEQLLRENDYSIHDLLQALVTPAASLALPFLSGFYVGAVGLGESGRIYFGANMEFPGATLASSVHAEQCLINNLLRHREQSLVSVAISAPPCGHCRQFLTELCCADSVELIFGQGPNNTYRIADVLPHRFGPRDLLSEEMPLLLQQQFHRMDFTEDARECLDRRKCDETLREAADVTLQAAATSYSPYTRSPAAVTLITDRGFHTGSIVENAAHNPTLQPLQAAFATAMLDGICDFAKVRGVILVELEGQPIQQSLGVKVLLDAVAPGAELIVLYAETI